MSQKTKALWKIVKNASLILLVLFGMWFVISSMVEAKHQYDTKYKARFEENERQRQE